MCNQGGAAVAWSFRGFSVGQKQDFENMLKGKKTIFTNSIYSLIKTMQIKQIQKNKN